MAEPNTDPNYRYHVNEQQKKVSAICSVGLALAMLFVIVRLCIRTCMQRQFSTDDYILLLATVLYCVLTGLMIYGFHEGGFGRATNELSYHVVQVGFKFLIVCEVTYIATSAFVKLSVAFLQLRIIGTANMKMRRINFASIAVNVVISIYTFFLLLFHCVPLRKGWTKSVEGGHCISKSVLISSVDLWSGISIGLDVYYAVGLIPLIRGLQIPRAVKYSTMLILGLGIFASIATIARFKYVIGVADTHNPLGSFGPIAMWSNVEIAAGLVATSMYTFRPLLRLLPCRLGFSSCDTYNRSQSYGADPFASSGSALHKLGITTSLKKLKASARERETDVEVDADLELVMQSHQRDNSNHYRHPYPTQHRECVPWGTGGGAGLALGTISLGMGIGPSTGSGGFGEADSFTGVLTPRAEAVEVAPRPPETLHRSSGSMRPPVPSTEQEAVNASLGGMLNGCSESVVTALSPMGSQQADGRVSALGEEGLGTRGIWKEETVEVRTAKIDTSEDDWASAGSETSSPRN